MLKFLIEPCTGECKRMCAEQESPDDVEFVGSVKASEGLIKLSQTLPAIVLDETPGFVQRQEAVLAIHADNAGGANGLGEVAEASRESPVLQDVPLFPGVGKVSFAKTRESPRASVFSVKNTPDVFSVDPTAADHLGSGSRASIVTIDPLAAGIGSGMTLLRATRTGRDSVVERALLSGAELDTTNEKGMTALQMAEEQRLTKIALKIISAGANVNIKDSSGNSPLHTAAWDGDIQVVQHLLDHKALVDARNPQGNTALHNAAQMSREEVAMILINAGADLHAVNEQNYTPGGLAEDMGTVRMTKQLSDCGATRERSTGGRSSLKSMGAMVSVKSGKTFEDAVASVKSRPRSQSE